MFNMINVNSIEELCDKALEYILSITIGNKNKNYNPPNDSSLKKGAVLKTYNFNIVTPAVNTKVTQTSTISISTSENIPSIYLNAITEEKITSDWEQYRDEYIYTKLNKDEYVSVSSMFLFLYLFRYFIDKKLCMFTDIYSQSSVWLYNTEDVVYSPNNMILGPDSLDQHAMNNYMNTLINEIVERDTLKVLKASSSSNSCSSSSSSSSCSSSSCSSSSSSSSCSSSSIFIAYFNIG